MLDTQLRASQIEFNSLQNYMAPIASLPEEVLAMVFVAGAESYQEKGLQFAILVSHVSRTWRGIALSTPLLWANIRCVKPSQSEDEPFHTPHRPYARTELERLVAFLVRSKTFPIYLYITHPRADDLDPRFIVLLTNHFTHLRHLSITDIDEKGISKIQSDFSRQPVPLLESVELGVGENSCKLFRLSKPLFSSGAPRLKMAQLNMIDFSTFHLCLRAFRSVTTLRLAYIYIDDQWAYASFRECLMALPSLTHLELQESFVDLKPSFQPIVLPYLLSLHASGGHTYGLLNVMGLIHAVSLAVLSLQGLCHSDTAVPELHFPSLQHLILLDVHKKVPVLTILNQLPSIGRLTCVGSPTSYHDNRSFGIDDFFAAISTRTFDDRNTPAGYIFPCPQLHTLAVSISPLEVNTLVSKILVLQEFGLPVGKLMLPKLLLAQTGARTQAMEKMGGFMEIEDFRVDWQTPFTDERFTKSST